MADERVANGITITNVKETIKALDAFAPDVRKQLNNTIRRSLRTVLLGAQSRYPKGAWTLNINNKRLLGSISTKAGGSERGTRWGDAAPGIKAAIFEFAGSTGTGATPQAAGLIKSLTERYGSPGRFLWDAWDAQGKGVLDTIETAVRQSERELQTRLDSLGESY